MDGAPRRRRAWWLVVVGLLIATVALVVALRWVVLRDHAREITTDEALERYRTQTSASSVAVASTTTASRPPSTTIDPLAAAPPAAPPPLPEPGVYRYSTTGHEEIDALDGATHPYPSETTISVVPGGCGVTLRWDALEERWDEWQLCSTAEGIALGTGGVQYHEFFGQADHETVACDVDVVVVATDDDPRPPVRQSCSLADDPWFPVWTVVERSHRSVDGHVLDVRHVRMQIVDDDEWWEHTTIDWYLASNGLPVEVVATKSSSSPSPIGAVRYDEEYRLVLLAATPLR